MLDCRTEKIQTVLKQAQQVGMMTAYHNYLITSLVNCEKKEPKVSYYYYPSMQDLHMVDLEEFKYGGTNVTAFRLLDPERPELKQVLGDWRFYGSSSRKQQEVGSVGTKKVRDLCGYFEKKRSQFVMLVMLTTCKSLKRSVQTSEIQS